MLSDTSALHFAVLSAAVFRKLSVRSRLRCSEILFGPLWLSLYVWTVGSSGLCAAFKSPVRLTLKRIFGLCYCMNTQA